MHKINASFAVGLNCPVSIELMVFLDTPTISASCCWDMFFSRRIVFKLFFNTSLSSIAYPKVTTQSVTAKAIVKARATIPYTRCLLVFSFVYNVM